MLSNDSINLILESRKTAFSTIAMKHTCVITYYINITPIWVGIQMIRKTNAVKS